MSLRLRRDRDQERRWLPAVGFMYAAAGLGGLAWFASPSDVTQYLFAAAAVCYACMLLWDTTPSE